MIRYIVATLIIYSLSLCSEENYFLTEDERTAFAPYCSEQVAQWLKWEARANEVKKPFGVIDVKIKKISHKRHPMSVVEPQDAKPPYYMKWFTRTKKNRLFFIWPFHPHNTLKRGKYHLEKSNEQRNFVVPFVSSQATATLKVPGALTASRSTVLFLPRPKALVSVKLPTNYPVLPKQSKSDKGMLKKADVGITIEPSVALSNFMRQMDDGLGKDPKAVVLQDSFAIVEEQSKNGYLIRDLSLLENGNYFLPAFSIPFVGPAIAEKHGKDFVSFFAEHFVQAVGEAKARVLLQYGLQSRNPNAQNILIELDPTFMPTGRIIFRDIADFDFVSTIGFPYGLTDTGVEAALHKQGVPIQYVLRPYFQNSVHAMSFAKEGTERYWEIYRTWLRSHNQAYINTVLNELWPNAQDLPSECIFDQTPSFTIETFAPEDSDEYKLKIRSINHDNTDFLFPLTTCIGSTEGINRLMQYAHSRLDARQKS